MATSAKVEPKYANVDHMAAILGFESFGSTEVISEIKPKLLMPCKNINMNKRIVPSIEARERVNNPQVLQTII